MSSEALLEDDPTPLIACTISRDVQNFDLLIEDMETELFQEFFNALAGAAGITLHMSNFYGENNHHIIESVYKACAKAMRMAVEIDPRAEGALPSTKGAL